MVGNLGEDLTPSQQFRDPEEDEDEICDVCEMPVEDCVCEEFDDADGEEVDF